MLIVTNDEGDQYQSVLDTETLVIFSFFGKEGFITIQKDGKQIESISGYAALQFWKQLEKHPRLTSLGKDLMLEYLKTIEG